jgi:hypothetical protein
VLFRAQEAVFCPCLDNKEPWLEIGPSVGVEMGLWDALLWVANNGYGPKCEALRPIGADMICLDLIIFVKSTIQFCWYS